jgi:predicted DNA-binding helix-hairpin-helix protein
MPVSNHKNLPAPVGFKPPLLREHRLYQADWLLRFYGFTAQEILDDSHPNFDAALDPKSDWALRHPEFFPVEVNRADYEAILRVPGIGVRGAQRIVTARRCGPLTFEGLKRLGIVMKRAQYFITCSGRMLPGLRCSPEGVYRRLAGLEQAELGGAGWQQMTLFDGNVS